jgi:hypothetical protein
LHRRAEEVAVTEAAAAMEKAAIPAPMIRSTGMTRNATSAKKRHPATHCSKKPSDNDDRSTASAASSVKKLKKDLKSIKKAVTMVNTQRAQLKEADSEISESEGEEALHFQVDQALQFAQLDKKKEVSVVWFSTGDMIGDYATKPLQGGIFRKLRDQIMGVTPARDPGPEKTEGGVVKTETRKSKPKKVKVIRLVPPWENVTPQECVGSRTRDRAKAGPGLVKKIADLTIFNQSMGKSGSYAHAARVGMQNH